MPERIVLIDDNANDMAVTRRFLERRGYLVDTALSGEDGLRLAAQVAADAIVVDYRMPIMDGFEVARQVKAHPQLQTVPVLMLTGSDSVQHIVDGLAAGADDYVTKGSDLEVVHARLRALLRVKTYQDQLRRMNHQMVRDLQIARRVQQALVPSGAFAANHVEIRSAYIPSEALSGDFYDYFSIGDTTFLFVADVSGHGLPSAILVSMLKSYIHTEAAPDHPLADFMTGLNDFLFSVSLPTQFATGVLFRISSNGRLLEYSNAAHPPFLLLRAADGKAELIEQPSNLLGAIPEVPFDQHEIEIQPGDTLLAYTDGLTDRRDEHGVFYTIESMAALLEAEGKRDLDALYDVVFNNVTSFRATDEFRDDIAFVLARFR